MVRHQIFRLSNSDIREFECGILNFDLFLAIDVWIDTLVMLGSGWEP